MKPATRSVFDEEHESLRQSLRDFLAARSSEDEVRRLMDTPEGYSPQVWAELAKELGLTALVIPEEFGGTGAGQRELTVVFEELGRVLAGTPLFATVALATNALLCSGDEAAQKRYLPAICEGTTVATLAHVEADGNWATDAVALAATQGADGWTLSGRKSYVVDGSTADLILTTARTPDGIGLFAVSAAADGLRSDPVELIDRTRKYANLRFDDVTAEQIGAGGDTAAALTRTLDLAAISLAAEQLGGAQRLLEMTVEYAKLRTQFGRAIGSFQAIKHACVNMLLAVEGARSALYEATWSADENRPNLRLAASLAQATCSDVFYDAALVNIHVHGGIGFTWEHPAHLYYRRAKCSQMYLGNSTYHRALIADQIGV